MTFDTSALLALFDNRQPHHAAIRALAMSERGPLVIPVGIMSETTCFVEQRMGNAALKVFLEDILNDVYVLQCGEKDIERILELTERYGDFPLGYADAAVIACAERHGGRVATLDHRHFGVVAREGTIQIVP